MSRHVKIIAALDEFLVRDTIGIVISYACEPYLYLGRRKKRGGWSTKLHSLFRPGETTPLTPMKNPFVNFQHIYLQPQVFAEKFGLPAKEYYLHFAAAHVRRQKSVLSTDQKFVYTLDFERRKFSAQKVVLPVSSVQNKNIVAGNRKKENHGDEKKEGRDEKKEGKEEKKEEVLPLFLNTRIISPHVEIVYHNQKVYFFGVDKTAKTPVGKQTIWIYHVVSRLWQEAQITEFPVTSGFALAKGDNEDAYLTGGHKNEGISPASKKCWKLNLQTLTSREISDMPDKRTDHFSFFCEAKLYICGGNSEDFTVRPGGFTREYKPEKKNVLEYNPQHDEWRALPIICAEPLFALTVYQ